MSRKAWLSVQADILAALRKYGAMPVAGLEEKIGCDGREIRKQLQFMIEDGRVERVYGSSGLMVYQVAADADTADKSEDGHK